MMRNPLRPAENDRRCPQIGGGCCLRLTGGTPGGGWETEVQLNFVWSARSTGVELAGTLAEIPRRVLANEFSSINP
jgi:hypothetical protein